MKHNATGYLAQVTDLQDDYSNSAIIAEQNGWQAYYQYAKQLYATGDQEHADQYFAYAQQLYNAELEKEKQMSVVDTRTNHQDNTNRADYYDGFLDPEVEQDGVTQVSPPPTWETYYTYAKQLYAAGYRKQAEAYYHQAQQIFNQVDSRAASQNQSPRTYESNSYMPSQTNHMTANTQSPRTYESNSYMPSQTNHMTADTESAFDSDTDYSALTDVKTIAVKWPRRSQKKRVKRWVMTSLVIGSLIILGGFIGLFFFHKHQLNQETADGAYDNSTGWFQSSILQPMVDVFEPVFEKTVRLSLAAQPLLYELKIRDNPLGQPYSETLNKEKTSGENDSKLAMHLETNDAKEMDETGSPVEPEKENAIEMSPASAPSDEADGHAIDSPKAPEAPAEMVIEPVEDPEEVATVARRTSPSHRRSRRSASRKSAESYSQQFSDSEPVESYPQQQQQQQQQQPVEVKPVEVKPVEVKPVESYPQQAADSISEDEAELVAPPSAKPSKTKELDILLAGGKKPKAKPSPPPNRSSVSVTNSSSSSTNSSTSLGKESLSRSDVQQGMAQVAAAVKQCGRGKGGIISLNIAIGQNGRISSAVAMGGYSGTPIGACAERAVRRARFPASQKSLSVKYPFKL